MDRAEIEQRLVVVERLQNICISRATGGSEDNGEYKQLREVLHSDEELWSLAPRFLKTCRDIDQFWGYIKVEYSTYHDRRTFLWNSFRPLISRLEGQTVSPIDQHASEVLGRLDVVHVEEMWERALARRFEEPDAAITAARTLMESTCKVLLEELGEEYSDKDDLPKLYRRVAEVLNLAPSQHIEPVFKQILGGCQAVVEGLGSVRNKLGDAHGTGRQPVKPDHRHAELAVNLAGTMAVFLVRTWEKCDNAMKISS